jgi:hypothetical protein
MSDRTDAQLFPCELVGQNLVPDRLWVPDDHRTLAIIKSMNVRHFTHAALDRYPALRAFVPGLDHAIRRVPRLEQTGGCCGWNRDDIQLGLDDGRQASEYGVDVVHGIWEPNNDSIAIPELLENGSNLSGHDILVMTQDRYGVGMLLYFWAKRLWTRAMM